MHYYYSYKQKHLGIILNFFFYFGMRSHGLRMWNFSSVNILVEEEKEKKNFQKKSCFNSVQGCICWKNTEYFRKLSGWLFDIWRRQKDSARDNTYTVHDLYKISITPRDKLKEATKEWEVREARLTVGVKINLSLNPVREKNPNGKRILLMKWMWP